MGRVLFGSSKRGFWLAGIAAVTLVATAAQAQPAYNVHLTAAGLEPSLIALAAQTRQQIFFHKSVVAGRRAPAVDGNLTPEQALVRLLAGTDLRARRVSPALIVIERPRGAAEVIPVKGGTEPDHPFEVAAIRDLSDAPLATSGVRADRPPAAAPEAALVDEVRVTGSNIRGAPPASPLIVLSHDDLERTGQSTLVDAIRSIPENFGGGAAEGANTAGSDRVGRNGSAGTAINLRGVGNNATLVLVNGRRVAGSGVFGDYVDVSTIPTGAVQRVEVLLDGASAIYGSDAVGGVVNIIMRKPFTGAEATLMGGIGTSGEPAQGRISATVGTQWTGGGLVFSYELQRRDYLSGDDRDFAADADLRRLGGTDQRLNNAYPGNILLPNPATGVLTPTYAIPTGQNGIGLRPGSFLPGVINRTNQRQGVDILPRQTLNALYLSAEQAAGDRLVMTADARYSARRFKVHTGPLSASFTVTPANPFYVSPIGAASETIAYSFANEIDNPETSGTTETLASSLGGTLKLAHDWRAEAYVAYAQEIAEVRNAGALNSAFLSEALGTVPDRPDTAFNAARDGFFNPFTGIAGSNSAATLAHISSGFAINRARSYVKSVAAQADGSLWSLPAGAVKLAFGAQTRRETLKRDGSNFFSTAVFVPQVQATQGRTVTAAFAEIQAPLFGPNNRRPGLERLDLSLAGRVEHYQSFGTTANPKVGVVWGPTQDLNLRLSYGTSFRAPAIREAFDAPLYSPTQFTVGAGRVQGLSLGGGNVDLKPETATTWALGFDYRPQRWPGLSLSASAYDIRFHDRIDRPVGANLANALTDPTLSSFVTRISPSTNAADRALIVSYLSSPFLNTGAGVFTPESYGAIVDNRYVNTATLRVRGLDVNGAYGFDLGDDRVVLAANATYVLTFDQQITPTSAVLDRVNLINFPVRFRGRATVDWTHGAVTLGGAFNYVSAYHDSLGARIGDQSTFDLQARLAPPDSGAFRGLSVLLNLRNVFDRAPPFYNNSVGLGYDGANADIIGRFVSVQLTRRW